MYPDSSCHYRFRSFASQELIFLQFYNMKTNDPSPPPRSNLYLVGLMGTGKTTLGKMLARNLGMNFLDSDQEIEKTVKKNVSQIFHQKGEAHFRSLEKDCTFPKFRKRFYKSWAPPRKLPGCLRGWPLHSARHDGISQGKGKGSLPLGICYHTR